MNMRRRIEKLERAANARPPECPGCAKAAKLPLVFYRDDGTRYPCSRPDACPDCGRIFGPPAKVYFGIDPDRV